MDPYAPCPCGSGKKVKFCCQKIIPEMERIERLQENQPETALAHLDKLEQTSPGNPWVVTTRAGTLMQQGEFASAKLALLKFLKEHPDHPRANALYAFASFHADGFPASKKAVHRAFKRCIEESPRIVSALLEALGEQHFMQANLLAARAHLVLAMRIAATPEDRERIVSSILRFDSDRRIPFLLRGGQHIPHYDPPESAREPFERARHLSLLGCWEEAADLLEPLTEQDPQSAPLAHLIGLFRAWDGDEESAAEAFHRAARLYDDREKAVECETIAQFLDHSHSDRVVPMRLQRYVVSSVSQLLTRLDEHPRLARSEDSGGRRGEAGEPAATYLVLDRDLPSEQELSELNAETVPLYWGRVLVFDANPQDNLPASAFVTALEGEALNTAEEIFTSAAAGLAERKRPTEPEASSVGDAPLAEAAAANETDAELDVIGEIFEDELPLHRNYFVPPGVPGQRRAEIIAAHWRRSIDEIWPESPLESLGGKSPTEAAGDAERQVALEAAVNLLEAFCDERGELLDVHALRERLGLPPLKRITGEEAPILSQLSGFDLLRLDIGSLSDVQMDELLERLRLSTQSRLVYEALQEWHGRNPGPPQDRPEWSTGHEGALAMLSEIATECRRPEEALKWIGRGIEQARQSEDHGFERELMWKMRELKVRVTYHDENELRPLLLELWERFGAKLPSLRKQLTQVVQQLRIDPPWEGAIVTAGAGWTPGSDVAQPATEKKLWLPGQD